MRFFVSIDLRTINNFEQLSDSVRVLRPHCRNFEANDLKNYCAAACAGTHAEVPRQLMNRCTKYGAIDLFTLESDTEPVCVTLRKF